MSGTYTQWQEMYKIALANNIKTMGEMEVFFKEKLVTKNQKQSAIIHKKG